MSGFFLHSIAHILSQTTECIIVIALHSFIEIYSTVDSRVYLVENLNSSCDFFLPQLYLKIVSLVFPCVGK